MSIFGSWDSNPVKVSVRVSDPSPLHARSTRRPRLIAALATSSGTGLRIASRQWGELGKMVKRACLNGAILGLRSFPFAATISRPLRFGQLSKDDDR